MGIDQLTPACCFPQTPSVVERNIENQNVSAGARAKRAKLDDNKCDLIECWDDLKIYCQGLSLVCDLRVINLYCIDGTPPSIIYSISISDDMKIRAFKYNSVVNIRDGVPSLDWKIRRYSELDNIIEKIRTFPINVQTEIKHTADTLRSQCDVSDTIEIPIRKRKHFLCDQLKLCCINRDVRRRYNAERMQAAVELMLRSRNCYEAIL